MKGYMTKIFYFLVGLLSAVALGLVFYDILRLDSSIKDLSKVTSPSYFWAYILITLGTVILFGVNISLLTYRVRKYGWPKFTGQFGAGAGSIIGVLASACPVCGSTLLSAAGVAGGLSAFPFAGLELKALSFGFMILPIFLTLREMNNFKCGKGVCPTPRDASYKESDMPWLVLMFALVLSIGLLGVKKVKTEATAVYFCQGLAQKL